MHYVRTMTSKGQVTIPAAIRKALGLKPRDKLAFRIDEGGVRLEPAQSSVLGGYRSVQLRGGTKDLKTLRRETQEWVADQALRED